ncbi:MAG: hypothetical protein ACRC2T_10050 [Thermoguttaceae bacterium]
MTFGDEVVVEKVVKEIENFSSVNGRSPSEEDVEKILLPYGDDAFSEPEFYRIYSAWQNARQSPISKKALIELFESKVQSIRSIKIKYQYSTDWLDKKKSSFRDKQNVSFIMDNNRLYSEKTYFSSDSTANKTGLSHEILAYNGKNLSIARFFFDKKRATEGVIENRNNLDELFPFEHPLYYSFLLNPDIQKLTGKKPVFFLPSLLQDKTRLSIIEENTVLVDGIECIQISNGNSIYIDPSKDFSIVKVEQFQTVRDSNGGEDKIKPTKIVTLTKLSDYGNGIWIPQNINIIYSFGDESDRTVTMTVMNVEVNKKIDEKTFTDIFPDDAVISDSVQNLVYIWSDRASIGGLLKDTVQSKVRRTWQWLSMGAGLVLIIVALLMKYRNYRNKNGTPT